MTSTLVLCLGCSRHFRTRDEICPFCGTKRPETFRGRPAPLGAGASRSRRYAARAVLLAASVTAACSDDDSGSGLGGRACEGSQNPTGYTLCRTTANCTGLETCYATLPSSGCRPNIQPQDCASGAPCQPGFVCSAGECGSHTCIPECTASSCSGTNVCSNGLCVAKTCDLPGSAACDQGNVCSPGAPGASAIGCVPVHCGATDPCEKNQDCVASQPGRGCVTRACTTDANCDCGYCVNSQCQPTLGLCYQVVATPYGCVWPDEELV